GVRASSGSPSSSSPLTSSGWAAESSVALGASVPLSGRYTLQGRSMQAGLELWARDYGRELVTLNDESRPQAAIRAHEQLVEQGCGPVLGPYGSDTTRAVACARGGRVVWNHGASADDVQRLPGVVSVATPASSYLVALAQAAARLGAA